MFGCASRVVEVDSRERGCGVVKAMLQAWFAKADATVGLA
jgi:hypothetical protein